MKVSHEYDTMHGGKVQVARTKDGGNSSWGEKDGLQEDSVRLAWYKEGGGFDPISSAELPMWGLKELMLCASNRDMLPKSDLAELIGNLTASIYRQT